ncbi:hypothetical protein BHE74_00019286 [Ensete ventricosum]|nr:hypothetical protein BHE74_00019286 [Ensete ventricosum]
MITTLNTPAGDTVSIKDEGAPSKLDEEGDLWNRGVTNPTTTSSFLEFRIPLNRHLRHTNTAPSVPPFGFAAAPLNLPSTSASFSDLLTQFQPSWDLQSLIFLLHELFRSLPIRRKQFQMRIRASETPPLSSSSNPNPTPPLSSPSNSPLSNDYSSRCEGLDLLVLAVIEVFGDTALQMEDIDGDGVGQEERKQDGIEMRKEDPNIIVEADLKRKRRRRPLATPSRFQDSVLQPWKRSTRRRLSGGKQ